jgi:hypothetical protein
LAVLVRRDVLGSHANEVADVFDSTVDAVSSAGDHLQEPASHSPSEDAIVAKFVAAYESCDLDSLVALLTDDVFLSMPPLPFANTRAVRRRGSWPASSAQAAGSTSGRPE